MAKKRFKMRFIFWLEPDKPDHDQLIDVIEQLKADRVFAPVLRDGIRLEADLREGRVDVLLEMHPWVAKAITAGQGVEDEIDSLRHEVELLKSVIAFMQSESQPAPPPGPRLLATAAPPPDDADMLVVKQAKNDGQASVNNFLDSAFGLQNK